MAKLERGAGGSASAGNRNGHGNGHGGGDGQDDQFCQKAQGGPIAPDSPYNFGDAP